MAPQSRDHEEPRAQVRCHRPSAPTRQLCRASTVTSCIRNGSTARTSAEGELVLMDDQDRGFWDTALIAEGKQLVEQALASQRYGSYTLQAAINAVHVDAQTAGSTDWAKIVSLYDRLLKVSPSPVVELNRAVAIAMHKGPSAGLAVVDDILARGVLDDYYLTHSVRADFYRRLGKKAEARAAYQQALTMTQQAQERRFLEKRLHELG